MRKKCAVMRERIFAVAARALVGPLQPVGHAEVLFDGHEEGVIIKPRSIFTLKDAEGILAACAAALRSQPQKRHAVFVELAVVDVARIRAEVYVFDFLGGQKTFLNEQVEIDKVGVARVA